ncbi:TAXI family TRAP transporter solute-binding subunit [Halostagnicola sp. A-GB9-2]|uniref:TAXI family TRAP transporter solute-binding subunit n=1 Tax=Halostagnicola sp. A-GB9-2 TaxID=3048066 RepID=UPI0024C09701|nr:TAXI family TRAP transporter solute-binding subunit [Halostagnicola sp. A-GB9-2]MDJ1434376.1 TAXI family TRAP transporter solute-binding subunit [Halostagnicola sp. A-GB9-2]
MNQDTTIDRRSFLKGTGAASAVGIATLSGCLGEGGGENELVIGTAASATANYASMQGFGSAVNENTDDIYLDVRPNDGMAANVGDMARGEMDLALLTDYNALLIERGEDEYADIDYELTQLLKTATTEWILVSNDEDITSYDDIDADTSVSAGPSGTAVMDYFVEIMELLEIEFDETPVGFGDMGSALEEGRIDIGLSATNNAPTADEEEGTDLITPGWVQQLQGSSDVHPLEMAEDQFETVSDEFTTFAIDPDLVDGYDSTPDSIPGMVQTTYLCAPADAEGDLITTMMETAWDQRDDMGTYHDFLTFHQYDDHWTRFSFDGFPFHSAAADFYEDVGAWDDDLERASE